MRIRCVIALTCVVSGGAVFVVGGCQTAPGRGATAQSAATRSPTSSSFDVTLAAVSEADFAQRHQFYYYPNARVYRDCDEDRWIWSRDGGLTWQSGRQLPLSIALGDEIPFAITLTSNEPAAEHTAIAAAYPPDDATLTASGRARNDE